MSFVASNYHKHYSFNWDKKKNKDKSFLYERSRQILKPPKQRSTLEWKSVDELSIEQKALRKHHQSEISPHASCSLSIGSAAKNSNWLMIF